MIYKAEVLDSVEEYYVYRLLRYETIVDAEILRNKNSLKKGNKIEIDFSFLRILPDSDKEFLIKMYKEKARFSHVRFDENIMVLGV
jgi:hypothetical protein